MENLNPHSNCIMAGCEALAAVTMYDLLKHRTPAALIRAALTLLAANPNLLVSVPLRFCLSPPLSLSLSQTSKKSDRCLSDSCLCLCLQSICYFKLPCKQLQ